jgi:hypothetical protein
MFTFGTMHPLHFWAFVSGTTMCCFGGFVWIIFLSAYRWNHVGSVVSGDLCPENEICNYDAMQGYMTSSGNFFRIWLIIVYCIWGCACIQGFYSNLYNSGKINWGRPAEYFQKYERVSLLGVGAVGVVWKVKKRNPEPGEEEKFYASKEFKSGPIGKQMFPQES